MRQSILLTAVLGTLAFANVSYAEEAKAEEKSDWTLSSNVGFVSDYYARGISQNWHRPSLQGGIDIEHSSGFSAGVWGSTVTSNTFPDAGAEIDLYASYGGDVKWVEGLGYHVGVIGYIYPGASWKNYRLVGDPARQTPTGGRFDTYEANFGLSYGWFSTQFSYTLSNWFGGERSTGWDGSTKGSTYVEINADIPLPWYGLTLVAHVGQLNVNGKLNTAADFSGIGGGAGPSTSISMASSPDYVDFKLGLSKDFKIANSDGWTGGIYYVGASNREYWGSKGYGGASFSGGFEAKNLADDRLIFSLTRTF